MHVHALQFDPAWEDKPTNRARIEDLARSARPAPGDLLVLPEMCLTGYSLNPEKTLQSSQHEDDEFFRQLAVQHQCNVIAGVVSATFEEQTPAANEAVAYCGTGAELGRYVKRQPFTLVGEEQIHSAGSKPVVFPVGGFRVSPLICYDLRFPELAREAVSVGGADMLVVIASWPATRQQHWLTLLQARAIENQCYVIGVNRCGADPSFSYAGRSVIIDPQGVIVADGGERVGVVSAACQPEVAGKWREEFPALMDAGLRWGGTPPATGLSSKVPDHPGPTASNATRPAVPGGISADWNLQVQPHGGERPPQPLPTLNWHECKKIIHQIDNALADTTLPVPRESEPAPRLHP